MRRRVADNFPLAMLVMFLCVCQPTYRRIPIYMHPDLYMQLDVSPDCVFAIPGKHSSAAAAAAAAAERCMDLAQSNESRLLDPTQTSNRATIRCLFACV